MTTVFMLIVYYQTSVAWAGDFRNFNKCEVAAQQIEAKMSFTNHRCIRVERTEP
jgi:hypothetical protein